MPYVLVRHKVQDYAQWKPLFDGHSPERQKAGCAGGQLFRSADDPNEVLILMGWDSLENARRFFGSKGLEEKMAEAGVTDRPNVFFLDETDRPVA